MWRVWRPLEATQNTNLLKNKANNSSIIQAIPCFQVRQSIVLTPILRIARCMISMKYARWNSWSAVKRRSIHFSLVDQQCLCNIKEFLSFAIAFEKKTCGGISSNKLRSGLSQFASKSRSANPRPSPEETKRKPAKTEIWRQGQESLLFCADFCSPMNRWMPIDQDQVSLLRSRPKTWSHILP